MLNANPLILKWREMFERGLETGFKSFVQKFKNRIGISVSDPFDIVIKTH